MNRYSEATEAGTHSASHPSSGQRRSGFSGVLASTPAYVFIAAVLVAVAAWSPALVGALGSAVVMSIAGWALVSLTSVRETALGRSRSSPPSARRRALLIAVAVVTATSIGPSFVAAVTGHTDWCLPIAMIAFLLLLGGVWAHERAVAP